jgi:hypothetical protein
MLITLTSARGEFEFFAEAVAETSPNEWGIILAGCVTGTLIGWAGWYCRDLVSATSYTLIGVANKMLTVHAHARMPRVFELASSHIFVSSTAGSFGHFLPQ